jgi:hypothetical protein
MGDEDVLVAVDDSIRMYIRRPPWLPRWLCSLLTPDVTNNAAIVHKIPQHVFIDASVITTAAHKVER